MSKKIITPACTLSYPHLDLPQKPMNGVGEPKYSASLVFAPGTDISALQAAVLEAATEKWGTNAAVMLKTGKLVNPLRTDAEAKGYEAGAVFTNARSAQKPGAVYAWADESGKPAVIPEDRVKTDLYPGALVRASLTAFVYDRPEKKGVSFGLNNIQKLGDGARLDGRRAANEEFEADPSAAPADLSDVE